MSKSWKKTRKALITFDNIFAHFISNKKSNSVVTELFTRDRKIYISLVFISPSYFKVPKDVKLNSTHHFILKISNKREFRQIAVDHPSDIDYKEFSSNSVVTELFTRDRKIYISLVFISPSYFKVPKDVKLNSTHHFILKISNKREFRQIAVDHPSDIDYKDFMKIFKKCIIKPYFS